MLHLGDARYTLAGSRHLQRVVGPVVMEPTHLFSESEGDGVQFGDSLVVVSEMGCAQVLLANPKGYTWKLEKGSWIGRACEATCFDTPAESDTKTTEMVSLLE